MLRISLSWTKISCDNLHYMWTAIRALQIQQQWRRLKSFHTKYYLWFLLIANSMLNTAKYLHMCICMCGCVHCKIKFVNLWVARFVHGCPSRKSQIRSKWINASFSYSIQTTLLWFVWANCLLVLCRICKLLLLQRPAAGSDQRLWSFVQTALCNWNWRESIYLYHRYFKHAPSQVPISDTRCTLKLLALAALYHVSSKSVGSVWIDNFKYE